MVRLIESTAGDRATVRLHLDPNAGRIMADAAQLEQLVLNLVVHCCEALPEVGQLTLDTSRAQIPARGDFSKLTVSCASSNESDIQGANEDALNGLFESSTLTAENTSLAIALNIASNHDGYLQARERTDGSLRFELLLPRWTDLESSPAPDGEVDQPTILLVEPREVVRAQVHNFFEANGYNLLEASDAAEAIALAEIHEGSLDLFVARQADLQQVLEQLQHRHPDLRTLAVVEDPQAEGPDQIRSPYTQVALIEKISALLSGKQNQATGASAN